MPQTETLHGSLATPRIPYRVVTVSLDSARSNELVSELDGLTADFMAIVNMVNPSSVAVTMRLNYRDAAPIPLESGINVKCPPEFLKKTYSQAGIFPVPPIRRVYLTHNASPGGFLVVAVGGDASFEIGSSGTVVVIGVSTMVALLNALLAATTSELQRSITGVDLSAALAATTTPLPAGATWTSGWFVADRYATIVATIVADQNCRVFIEQSWDAANVDAVEWGNYPDPSGALGSGDGYHTQVVAPHGRVRIQNTGVAGQTLLRFRAGGRAI